MLFRVFFIFFLFFTLFSCSKKQDEEIFKKTNTISPYELYSEGLIAFEKNDYFFASKKFTEAEQNFEKVELSAKSSIMASYSLYAINFYDEALENIENYLKLYPSDKNISYAHYLKAIIYYEQISDEKRDLEPLIKADKQINFFLKKFPNTDYAVDLEFKKNLIKNQLAAKELFVAKYYIEVQKWVPAINRLRKIVKNFDETIFVEEALHRLVEIHYHIGLEQEAKKYASILGYNYNSSEWFEQSYKILNQDYKIPKKINEKKDDSFFKNILKKIK